MKQMKLKFVDSWHELKEVRTLVFSAMMIAVAVVLGYFTVQVENIVKIGFSFLANELSAFMFGPVVGSIVAGLADIVKYLVKPTGPFFPGFTISAVVGGLIYGVILYQRPLRIRRVLIAKVIVTIVVNVLMNTYWLTLLNGSGFMAILPLRLLKQMIMVPLEVVLFYTVTNALTKVGILRRLEKKAEQ